MCVYVLVTCTFVFTHTSECVCEGRVCQVLRGTAEQMLWVAAQGLAVWPHTDVREPEGSSLVKPLSAPVSSDRVEPLLEDLPHCV